jgi:hypothetical protein
MYLPIYTIIEIWSIIIINLFTLASKFGVKIKKHRKPGQNRKRTGPPPDQSFSGFAPAFDASFYNKHVLSVAAPAGGPRLIVCGKVLVLD